MVVPPPISRFSTLQCRSFEAAKAPLPFPAITDSMSGPAAETTNSPATPESSLTIASAFSLRADSPVMITAPVLTSSGRNPAFRYSLSTSSLVAAASIWNRSVSGVKCGSLR